MRQNIVFLVARGLLYSAGLACGIYLVVTGAGAGWVVLADGVFLMGVFAFRVWLYVHPRDAVSESAPAEQSTSSTPNE
jgi:hypothetical protein